jgi:hypothetical protein
MQARNARQPLADLIALVPSRQLLLQPCNRGLDVLDLRPQEHLPRYIGQLRTAVIANNGDQLGDIAQSLRRDDSELR